MSERRTERSGMLLSVPSRHGRRCTFERIEGGLTRETLRPPRGLQAFHGIWAAIFRFFFGKGAGGVLGPFCLILCGYHISVLMFFISFFYRHVFPMGKAFSRG